ncbi:MAG: PQQ-dependent sugar dehydrogenase [Planctomycetales bacterium]
MRLLAAPFCFVLFLLFAARVPDLHAEPTPANRPLFTTSRLTNPPEPPSPYATERLWPKLKFNSPVDLTFPPGGDRMFVVEQYGKIFSFPTQGDPATADLALDFKTFQPKAGQSYALAFHPRFAENRFCYICYILEGTLPNGTRVSRFKVKDTNPPTIDPASEVILIEWLAGGHNGCALKFGPDGYLYISTGDGAGPSPPDGLDTGQNLTDLLSCILRIDVDHPGKETKYSIPRDNPFVDYPGARGEIWAYGLRNPWRMSFDPRNGNLWVGDVGWELWELLFRVEKGANFGWSVMEGRQSVRPTAKLGPTPIIPPVIEHPHSEAASITGGVAYYGQKLPELQGKYIYGDFETGKIWSLLYEQGSVKQHRELLDTPLKIVCFSDTPQGELCILDFAGGGIHTLARNPKQGQPHFFPRKLSETGLFASTRDQTPAPGVIPYSLVAEPWQDGATAERWIALSEKSAVSLNKDSGNVGSKGPLLFPEQSLFVKTLSIPSPSGSQPRKIETQILHIYQGYSLGYSYRWNEDQTDAELVDASGREDLIKWPTEKKSESPRTYRWHFHSRAECVRCHNPWTSFVIGFTPEQLDRPLTIEGKSENQLARFKGWGLIASDVMPTKPGLWADPSSASASLENRARTYLHLNCAHCHRMSAGGSTNIELNYDFPLDKTHTVGIRPLQGMLGLHQAQIVSAGDPYRSVLFYRLAKIGTGHMPHIGAHEVDDHALRLIHEWIRAIPPQKPVQDPKNLTLPEQAILAESAAGAKIRADEDKLIEELNHPPFDLKTLIPRLLSSNRIALRLSMRSPRKI